MVHNGRLAGYTILHSLCRESVVPLRRIDARIIYWFRPLQRIANFIGKPLPANDTYLIKVVLYSLFLPPEFLPLIMHFGSDLHLPTFLLVKRLHCCLCGGIPLALSKLIDVFHSQSRPVIPTQASTRRLC